MGCERAAAVKDANEAARGAQPKASTERGSEAGRQAESLTAAARELCVEERRSGKQIHGVERLRGDGTRR